jgi:hypothetical protein
MAAWLRKMVCCALIALTALPTSLFASEPAAMLYARGTTWVNGAPIPRASAIFAGDLVQTKSDSAANIHLPGSVITVLPESLARFEGRALELEHGGMVVVSSKQLPAHVGGITIVPAKADWTEFWAGDTDGTVTIMARKGAVMVTDETGTTTLSPGQETTREEPKKKKKKRGGGAIPGATGSIMDSKAALIGGVAAVGVITTIVLLQREDPISPARMGP